MSGVSDNEADGNEPHIRLHVDRTNPRWIDFMPEFRPGWVWLTGAGPGDPGLLTLQAFHGLQTADVIFHDALVSPQVLALIPADTPKIPVGKRAGKKSMKQHEISDLLIDSARTGKRVLRLKGGDPFVFGRGAEEASQLSAGNVPFRILPGVTSGIGGLAYAGLPVSHRDVNQAFTFVTAHDATGGLSAKLDWGAVSRGSPVIVIYMGFRLISQITERLIAEGRPGSEPVAVVSKATTADQAKVITTLERASADVELSGLEPPVLIVVGRIVEMHSMLDWAGGITFDAMGDERSVTTA